MEFSRAIPWLSRSQKSLFGQIMQLWKLVGLRAKFKFILSACRSWKLRSSCSMCRREPKPQRLIRCSDSTMSMSDSVLECCILRLLSSHICLDLSVPRPAIPKRRGRREFWSPVCSKGRESFIHGAQYVQALDWFLATKPFSGLDRPCYAHGILGQRLGS